MADFTTPPLPGGRGPLAAPTVAGPGAEPLRAPADSAGPTTAGLQGRRVLLVEDNVVNQEVAVDLLRASGLAVDIAGHGAEALERVAASRYDLVLMDVQMPVMDGLAATRALRARFGPALPIVAMTANAWADRQTCLDAGMNDHLGKPIDPALLQAGLLRWLPPVTGVAATAEASPAPASAPTPAPTLASKPAAAPATVGTDATASLESALAHIDGLNLPAALRSVGGRMALLERILRRFVEHYGGRAGVLPDPAAPEGRAALAASCHALRGACATIGAGALAAALHDLEAAASTPSADLTALASAAVSIRADLDRLLRGLTDALGD